MVSLTVSEEPATAVVVPVRSFEGALSRLEHVLGRAGCRDLMRRMASRVVAAAGGLPVHVATDDAEVAAWAAGLGAEVVAAGRPGLNIAVSAAVDRLAAAGVERAVVAHADLALARTLRPATGPGLVIVPDGRRDGSNVVCVPTACGFRFSYGPRSFARHLFEAERLQLAVTVVQDDALASDIDRPEDLLALPAQDRLVLGLDQLAAGASEAAAANVRTGDHRPQAAPTRPSIPEPAAANVRTGARGRRFSPAEQ